MFHCELDQDRGFRAAAALIEKLAAPIMKFIPLHLLAAAAVAAEQPDPPFAATPQTMLQTLVPSHAGLQMQKCRVRMPDNVKDI